MADSGTASGPAARASSAGLLQRAVRPVVSGRTWLAVIHLLAGPVIGLVAFVFFVTAASVGVALLPVALAGIPVLAVTLWLCTQFAAFERPPVRLRTESFFFVGLLVVDRPGRRARPARRGRRRGGATVTAGLPPPDAALPVNIVNLVAEERTVKGSYIGTCVPSRDPPRFIDLYRQGRMAVNRLMSGKLALDEINTGFDLLHEGKAVRQVIVF